MRYLTIMMAALFIGGCASIKNASEIRLSGSASGPMGLPSKGDHEIYSYGASIGLGNADIGYGHSMIFGNSVSAGVYIPEIDAYIGNTYYYNNPYQNIDNWGNWLYVKKTVKISLKKEERKKKRDERRKKRAERRAARRNSNNS